MMANLWEVWIDGVKIAQRLLRWEAETIAAKHKDKFVEIKPH